MKRQFEIFLKIIYSRQYFSVLLFLLVKAKKAGKSGQKAWISIKATD